MIQIFKIYCLICYHSKLQISSFIFYIFVCIVYHLNKFQILFVESALNPSLTATPQVQRSMKQEQEKENVATRKEKFLKKKNVEKESEMQEQG